MTQQINLYNPIFLKRKKYFSAETMVQALVMVAVGTLAVYAYARHQAGNLSRLAVETEQQLVQQREQLIKLGNELSPQGKNRLLQDEIAKLSAQVAQRRALLETLQSGALGNRDGFSQHLAAFARQAMPGVWLVGIQLGGTADEVLLRGRVLRADLVPTYIRSLSGEPVMRGRAVTELKLAAKDTAPQKPGEVQSVAAKGTSRTPASYVEFDLAAPRQAPEVGSTPGEVAATATGAAR